MRGARLSRRSYVYANFFSTFLADLRQTLRGPFSAVSTPIVGENTRVKALDETAPNYKIRLNLVKVFRILQL